MTTYTKFRAWDKENCRMIYPSTDGVYFELTDDYVQVLDLSVEPFDDVFPFLDSIVLQSVGLKDYKDPEKDIFQGDVVEDLAGTKYTVSYNQEFCANFLCPVGNEESFVYFYPNIKLTVVGNVYENSELLEVS